MPASTVTLVIELIVTWFLGSGWGRGKGCFAIIICYLPSLIRTVILYAVPLRDNTTGVLLFAVYILNVIATCPPFMYSHLASNIAGYTKNSAVNSIFFIACLLGNIISPQAFLQLEAPTYTTDVVVTLVSF